MTAARASAGAELGSRVTNANLLGRRRGGELAMDVRRSRFPSEWTLGVNPARLGESREPRAARWGVGETVQEVEVRLLANMPKESPIDLRAHAHSIARVVIGAR